MVSIPIEVSARHIHINKEDWAKLFGPEPMAADHPISQHPQFSAVQRVTLRGPKAEMKNVAIVGPFRPYTQVELSATDARILGVAALLHDSGVPGPEAEVTIIGPKGELTLPAAIIPRRHIHMSPDEAAAAGVANQQIVSVRITGPRSATLSNVIVRTHPNFTQRLHLDTDEGNACGVTPGATADLLP